MKIKLLIFLFFVVSVCTAFYLESQRRKEYTDNYKKQKNLEVSQLYQNTIKDFEIPAQIIYNEIIHQEQVLNLVENAWHNPGTVRDAARDTLWQLLSEAYKNMSMLGYRQLHFHFPNNHSFLRFHKPDVYGDDLTGIRSTIEAANREKKIVSGFEEGRIYNGFRYVFPLLKDSLHIGSVETSVSFQMLNQSIGTNTDYICELILQNDVVEAKVFDQFKDFYEMSSMSDLYYHENAHNEAFNKRSVSEHAKADQVLSKLGDLTEQLAKNESFTQLLFEGLQVYQLSFLAIHNYDQKPIGYVIFLKDARQDLAVPNLIYFYITLLFLILIFALLFYVNHISSISRKKEAKVRQISETKDKLFSIISHDLMSPFSQISGFINLIRENRNRFTDAQMKHYLIVLQNNADNASRLLHNLLSWSRIQQQAIRFEPLEVDVGKVVDETIRNFQLMLDNKNIVVQMETCQDPFVCADPDMLKTVFRNLVSNAIKFSYPGSAISINLHNSEEGLKIKIKDQGTGMKPEKIRDFLGNKNISSNPGTRQEKGNGLGLALIRDFVTRHGGSIDIHSTENKGTVFTVSLPYHNCPQKQKSVSANHIHTTEDLALNAT